MRRRDSAIPLVRHRPDRWADDGIRDGDRRAAGGLRRGSYVVDSTGTDLIGAHARNTILQDMPLIEANLPGGKRVVIVAIFNDVSTQQNNGAELMALVAAMRIALCINCKVVASDSELLVSWWSKRLDTKKIGLMDPRKVQYVNELILLRKELEIRGGQLLKISGDNNPADLGYHK